MIPVDAVPTVNVVARRRHVSAAVERQPVAVMRRHVYAVTAAAVVAATDRFRVELQSGLPASFWLPLSLVESGVDLSR